MTDTTHESERVQPGGRVDKQVYEDFREFVRKRHGSVRGNLGTELEKAMKDRMHAAHGTTPVARIENDIATIKAILAEGESDGGAAVPTLSDAEDAHTHRDGKPGANAPRNRKVTYLLNTVLDEYNLDRDTGAIPTEELRHIIVDEYSFQEDRVDEYERMVVNALGAIEHPLHGNTYVWGEMLEEAKADVDDELDDL